MKLKQIISTAALMASISAHAFTVGAHVGSWHSIEGYNNFNPGAYVKSDDGWTAGAYYNSERRPSAYAGKTFEKDVGPVRVSVTVGAVTGYSTGRVIPLLVPSASVHVVGGIRARVFFIPAIKPKNHVDVLSLAIERDF